MARLLLAHAQRGLLAMRPQAAAADLLKSGAMLTLSGGDSAVVLATRAGLVVAVPLAGSHGAWRLSDSKLDAESAALNTGKKLMVGEHTHFPGGLILDCFGQTLDQKNACEEGAQVLRKAPADMFGAAPMQADLKPIFRSLHTGSPAIDTLTPIGRGQSMLLIGSNGTGKSSIARDAVLAQAMGAGKDMHCILTVSHGGLAAAHEAMEWFRAHSPRSLLARLCVVVSQGESAAERTLAASAACALGESVRDSGGHALVVLDELAGHLELWDETGHALRAENGGKDVMQHGSEQRAFYARLAILRERRVAQNPSHLRGLRRPERAALLQRASQLSEAKGGGSLSLLGLVEEDAKSDGQAEQIAHDTRSDAAEMARSFTLADFGDRSPKQRQRIAVLIQRGIRVDRSVLKRLGIPPPSEAPATRTDDAQISSDRMEMGADAPSAETENGAAHTGLLPLGGGDLTGSSMMHIDQLKSLADGHIQLHAHLFAAGRRPALEPSESLARVGAGSDIAQRPMPASAAMMQLAPSLRLELAQARDLPQGKLDRLASLQRARTDALVRALCSQRLGCPRSLGEQMCVLTAIVEGRLDVLADESFSDAANKLDALLAHVRAAAAAAIDEVDDTEALGDGARAQMRSAMDALMPSRMGQRALFVSWDASRPGTPTRAQ